MQGVRHSSVTSAPTVNVSLDRPRELIDESWSSSSDWARPNTVRADAHDLNVFFKVVKKGPARGAAQGRDGLRHRTAPSQARCRERGADRRWFGWTLGSDHQAASRRGRASMAT